jgi:hypothetical protein
MVAALLSGATVAEAATQAGVSKATGYRRMRDRDFVARLDHERTEMVRAARLSLLGEVRQSVRVLARLRDDDEALAAVRVSACRAILDKALPAQSEAAIDLTAAGPPEPGEAMGRLLGEVHRIREHHDAYREELAATVAAERVETIVRKVLGELVGDDLASDATVTAAVSEAVRGNGSG